MNLLPSLNVSDWKGVVHNAFEDSIFPNHSAIAELKEQLYSMGAVYASMTGSGSTVYGIFKEDPQLGDAFGEATVWSGRF